MGAQRTHEVSPASAPVLSLEGCLILAWRAPAPPHPARFLWLHLGGDRDHLLMYFFQARAGGVGQRQKKEDTVRERELSESEIFAFSSASDPGQVPRIRQAWLPICEIGRCWSPRDSEKSWEPWGEVGITSHPSASVSRKGQGI